MCQDKIKQRCKKVSAECVSYDRELPSFSTLTDCITIADTTEELYDFVGEIKTLLDLSDLESCESLPITRTPLTVFQKILDMICTQQSTIETMQGQIETLQNQVELLQAGTCP